MNLTILVIPVLEMKSQLGGTAHWTVHMSIPKNYAAENSHSMYLDRQLVIYLVLKIMRADGIAGGITIE